MYEVEDLGSQFDEKKQWLYYENINFKYGNKTWLFESEEEATYFTIAWGHTFDTPRDLTEELMDELAKQIQQDIDEEIFYSIKVGWLGKGSGLTYKSDEIKPWWK